MHPYYAALANSNQPGEVIEFSAGDLIEMAAGWTRAQTRKGGVKAVREGSRPKYGKEAERVLAQSEGGGQQGDQQQGGQKQPKTAARKKAGPPAVSPRKAAANLKEMTKGDPDGAVKLAAGVRGKELQQAAAMLGMKTTGDEEADSKAFVAKVSKIVGVKPPKPQQEKFSDQESDEIRDRVKSEPWESIGRTASDMGKLIDIDPGAAKDIAKVARTFGVRAKSDSPEDVKAILPTLQKKLLQQKADAIRNKVAGHGAKSPDDARRMILEQEADRPGSALKDVENFDSDSVSNVLAVVGGTPTGDEESDRKSLATRVRKILGVKKMVVRTPRAKKEAKK